MAAVAPTPAVSTVKAVPVVVATTGAPPSTSMVTGQSATASLAALGNELKLDVQTELLRQQAQYSGIGRMLLRVPQSLVKRTSPLPASRDDTDAAMLEQTLQQFRLELSKQVQRRLYSELDNDPNALFRMLEGVRRYIEWMADRLMDDASTPTNPIIAQQYINAWQDFFKEVNEQVRGTVQCARTVPFWQKSQLSADGSDATTKFLGAPTVQRQIASHFTRPLTDRGAGLKPSRFFVLYGPAGTGKSLLVRDAAQIAASNLRRTIGANFAGDDLDENFLQLHHGDVLQLRMKENATAEQIARSLETWLNCAHFGSQETELFFAQNKVPAKRRRHAMLVLDNFDSLFMTRDELRSEPEILEGAAAEDANQVIDRALQSVANTAVQSGLTGSETDKVLSDAELAGSLPSKGVPVQRAPLSSTHLDITERKGGAVGGGDEVDGGVVGGAVGDAQTTADLARIIPQLFDRRSMARFPRVWVVVTMRYPWRVPAPILARFNEQHAFVDLPSEALRKTIVEESWKQRWTADWAERIRQFALFRDGGTANLAARVAWVKDHGLWIPPATTGAKGGVHTLAGVLNTRSGLRGLWDARAIEAEVPYGQMGDVNWAWWTALESALLWYVAGTFMAQTKETTVAKELGKDENRQRLFLQLLIRDTLTTEQAKYGTSGQTSRSTNLASSGWPMVLYALYRRDRHLYLDPLKPLLVAYTGLGMEGYCMAQKVGIEPRFLEQFLMMTGRYGTLRGKFGFGLNVQEMYQLVRALSAHRHEDMIWKQIHQPEVRDREGRVVTKAVHKFVPYSDDFVSPDCRDSAQAFSAYLQDHQEDKPLSDKWNAFVREFGDGVETCAGPWTETDLNTDPMAVYSDFQWQRSDLSQAIALLQRTLLERAAPSVPKSNYPQFIKYQLFGNENAAGVAAVPSSEASQTCSRYRQMERLERSRATREIGSPFDDTMPGDTPAVAVVTEKPSVASRLVNLPPPTVPSPASRVVYSSTPYGTATVVTSTSGGSSSSSSSHKARVPSAHTGGGRAVRRPSSATVTAGHAIRTRRLKKKKQRPTGKTTTTTTTTTSAKKSSPRPDSPPSSGTAVTTRGVSYKVPAGF